MFESQVSSWVRISSVLKFQTAFQSVVATGTSSQSIQIRTVHIRTRSHSNSTPVQIDATAFYNRRVRVESAFE